MRGGNLPCFSMTLTRFGEIPASPISLSAASGGQVDIRNVGSTAGLAFSKFTPMAVMFFVASSVAVTSFVVWTRVVRYACGAKRMNQLLYISTDRAMSSFQRSGLSRLTAITYVFVTVRFASSACVNRFRGGMC